VLAAERAAGARSELDEVVVVAGTEGLAGAAAAYERLPAIADEEAAALLVQLRAAAAPRGGAPGGEAGGALRGRGPEDPPGA
jgi:predicted phosphoribosyltransferase